MEISKNGCDAFRETETLLSAHAIAITDFQNQLDLLKARVAALENQEPDPDPGSPKKPFVFFEDFSSYSPGDTLRDDRFIVDAPSGHVNIDEFDGSLAVECVITKRQDRNHNGHCKSEFRLRDPATASWKDTLREPFKQRRWYSWTQFLMAPWMYDKHKVHLMDMHGSSDENEGGRSPNIGFMCWHDEHRIRVAWNSNKVDSSNPYWIEAFRRPPVIAGRWVRMTIEAFWSYTDNGLLRIWMDDELIIDRPYAPNAYNDDRGPYLKLGLYAPSLSLKYNGRHDDDYPDHWQHRMWVGEIRIGEGEVFANKDEFINAVPL